MVFLPFVSELFHKYVGTSAIVISTLDFTPSLGSQVVTSLLIPFTPYILSSEFFLALRLCRKGICSTLCLLGTMYFMQSVFCCLWRTKVNMLWECPHFSLPSTLYPVPSYPSMTNCPYRKVKTFYFSRCLYLPPLSNAILILWLDTCIFKNSTILNTTHTKSCYLLFFSID